MKKQNVYLLAMLFAFILFFAGGCEREDEEPQLPPITQTGEDTFGCLVDGDIWLPKSTIAFPSEQKVSAELVKENGYRMWEIGASQGASSSFYFGIYKDSLKIGKINISVDEMIGRGIGLYFFSKKFESTSFSWQKGLPGELIITRIDTINMILSGTFWFNAINSLNEKVEIRDGRFDLVIDQIQP